MASPLVWLLAGLLAAGLVVGGVAFVESRPAPVAASPPAHGMGPDAMCQHMPEHCGNASAEGPP